MENFALIFVALIIGYIINKRDIFPKDTPIILNQFILYISLPAMALLQIPKLSFSFEVLIPIIIAWLVMGISALVIFYISKILKFSKEITGALMLVGVLGNTSFVGIPVIQAYFGDSALPYVLMYDQLGSFIMLSTYGTFISVYYSSAKDVDVKAIAIKIITFPPFLSLLVALFFIGTTFHPVITSVLSSLAGTIVPLALVAVGLQLKFKLPSEDVKPFFSALGVKLLLSPIIAILISFIFSWDNQASMVSIMEAGMGPMITAGAVASMAGLAPRLSSAIVGYGVLLSFLTTWILFKLIQL
ncbi:transport related membrane protein [Sulfurimonas gotlandica GD1]|uniref:Transport related membrane protein n=1 Tax=Sulfurimonas gotlandica (strain DSM 19862 / JCM 16533 / GD1) TaxID=929558 RepID=B6BK26_SULGG|nr:AEC family transporter [Sulfurimonas gotlandica]EDZ62639.1 auxin Efflux Carrier [Sulfurimonas gotlandica GD1]EHP31117.1 transport related membrane protein [Sulfurimonas gotlandica GD1]